MPTPRRRYQAVVVGGSAGGFLALRQLVAALRPDFPLPVLAALHVGSDARDSAATVLGGQSRLAVADVVDGLRIEPGQLYLAPPGYHMLVERDGSLALSIDERVSFSRPSIDVLIQTAADAYRQDLVAVILSGANQDGAAGLLAVRSRGGLAVVQDPATAEAAAMPEAALQTAGADHVLPVEGIAALLNGLHGAAP